MNIQVKPDAEKKLKQKYPWILDHEILEIPRGFRNGACVDFVNRQNEFLAFGYLNPQSKISGRILTFDSTQKSITRTENLSAHLLKCWKLRRQRGFRGSFRLCYGESDSLPGLVIDYYLLKNNHQVFVLQILTQGMEILLHDYLDILKNTTNQAFNEGLTKLEWQQTSIVLRNDVSVRKWEGLEVDIPRVIQTLRDIDLTQCEILVNEVHGPGTLSLHVDLYQGQKTGFFLDQVENIRRVIQFIDQQPLSAEPFKILDLCCYVGHWSAQLANYFHKKNRAVEIQLVDVSEKALAMAQKNVSPWTKQIISSKIDVLQGLDILSEKNYDLVIADPPAFIKSKKDLPTGQHAYAKMNAQAYRLVKDGGLVVSCSCSGLLDEDNFREALSKAQSRANVKAQMILRGSISSDHPVLASFPESGYLKMQTHQILRMND